MQESRTPGLRFDEPAAFVKFFQIVQEKARENGCTFFLESGEGNEASFGAMDVEDLSGWLVPDAQVEDFSDIYLKGDDDMLDNLYPETIAFANWDENDGTVSVRFEKRFGAVSS